MKLKPSVLVFAGLDPSGGAGIQADIGAIGALGAHPLPVVTTLTVQDNDRVHAIRPVDATLIREQADALIAKIPVSAVKIGIVGNCANAEAIADAIRRLRAHQPSLPVVLDPVLASGRGDSLSRDDAVAALAPLRGLATLITPNLPEAARLAPSKAEPRQQAKALFDFAPDVLIKGGHGDGESVVNRWYREDMEREWSVGRLPGSFHGTGCTLASGIAALLAAGHSMEQAIDQALTWCHGTLRNAYAIADGQRIPDRQYQSKEIA